MELERIRSLISRLRYLTPDEIEAANTVVSSEVCPVHLAPFWTLAEIEPRLFEKLLQDTNTQTYSIYGFFPIAYEQIYASSTPPDITFNGRTRGLVAILRSEDKGLVIKPLQSQREGEVAKIAADLKAGPEQYPSLAGFLTEEFVSGRFFTELTNEDTTGERLYQIGRTLGRMLSLLHQNQIYYNDTTLCDPEGRSHLLVQSNGDCRLIDFGVSVLLDRHPDLTPEEVYNCARTLPMFQMFSRMGVGGQDITGFVDQYRHTLAQTPISEILARDLRFSNEGIRLAAQRMGENIVEPLQRGFQNGYEQS